MTKNRCEYPIIYRFYVLHRFFWSFIDSILLKGGKLFIIQKMKNFNLEAIVSLAGIYCLFCYIQFLKVLFYAFIIVRISYKN